MGPRSLAAGGLYWVPSVSRKGKTKREGKRERDRVGKWEYGREKKA